MSKCMECGRAFASYAGHKAGRKKTKFCEARCRQKFHARRASRGAILYDIAMKMRKQRRKGDFANLTHQIGLFLAADREDGRVSFFDYADEPIPYQIPKLDPKAKR